MPHKFTKPNFKLPLKNHSVGIAGWALDAFRIADSSKVEVVTKTPFEVSPLIAPIKFRISFSRTLLSPYRFA